jgi:hypothetical protein
MPRGTYVHGSPGPDEVEERFSCAPDGGGWRYTAERSDGGTVELVADGRWRPARLQVTAGEHILRGGMAGAELLWVTAGREHSARATGFVGDSPGLLVAVARSLGLSERASADVRLLVLTAPALAVRTVPQRWTLTEITWHDADSEAATDTEPEPATDTEPATEATTPTEAAAKAGISADHGTGGHLPVERYEVTDLETGEISEFYLAGDVVVAAPGLELTGLEDPPNFAETWSPGAGG